MPPTRAKAYDPRSFDHMAEEYDFLASLHRRPEFFVEHLPQRRRRALDVGCGSGILAVALARLFDSVLAVDISPQMLELARTKRPASNLEYRYGDANDLDVEGPFDAVVSHTTLHHVDDLPATIRRLKSLVSPGGRLIVVDIIKGWLPLHPVVWVLGSLVDLPMHVRRFGVKAAWRVFRFRNSKPWLDHLRTDEFLEPDEFRRIYAEELPGAQFEPVPPFLSVVWVSDDASVGRGGSTERG